jgi:hypothetical protein
MVVFGYRLWLAKAGNERIDETIDPELSIDREQIEKSTGKPAISPLNAKKGIMIGNGGNKQLPEI